MNASRKSPLGCVIGLFSFIPLGLTGIGIYSLVTWQSLAPEKRPDGMLSLSVSCIAGGLVMTAGIIWLTASLLRRTDWTNHKAGKSHTHL